MILDTADLFGCYKWKKWFLWIIAVTQAAESNDDEASTDTFFQGYVH